MVSSGREWQSKSLWTKLWHSSGELSCVWFSAISGLHLQESLRQGYVESGNLHSTWAENFNPWVYPFLSLFSPVTFGVNQPNLLYLLVFKKCLKISYILSPSFLLLTSGWLGVIMQVFAYLYCQIPPWMLWTIRVLFIAINKVTCVFTSG